MELYTIAGAVIVSFCGIELSRRLNKEARRHLEIIDGFIALLRHIRVQIDCFALPICDIFARCDVSVLSACDWHEKEAPRSILELVSASSLSDASAKSILEEFGADFGKSYIDGQLKRCDACIAALEMRRGQLAAELPNKQKLHSTLSVAGALALIILLI